MYEKKKEAWDFRSNIQLKNYGQNSLMSDMQECTRALSVFVQHERHKMKQ